jgi:hypothetical protein
MTSGAWHSVWIELVVPRRVERVCPIDPLPVTANLDHLRAARPSSPGWSALPPLFPSTRSARTRTKCPQICRDEACPRDPVGDGGRGGRRQTTGLAQPDEEIWQAPRVSPTIRQWASATFNRPGRHQFHGNGIGHLEIAAHPPLSPFPAQSAADWDSDGKLDLFPQAVGLAKRLLLRIFFKCRYCRGG